MIPMFQKYGKAISPVLLAVFLIAGVLSYSFPPVSSFSDDNLSTCNGTLEYVCQDGFTYDNATKVCIGDVSCPGGGTYNQALGACTYCPPGTSYASSSNTCLGSPDSSACTGSYDLMSYNGGFLCEGSPSCSDNSSAFYDSNSGTLKCESQPTIVCKSQTSDIFNGFCTKRCYDARTDYPSFTDLNSDIPSDINKTFTIDVKKGFSGWGLLRPYSDGCFLKGKFQLCVSGGGTTLTLSFTFPDGTVKTVNGPLQAKYWNTYSWSVNPNMIGLVVRQHGTNTVTFHYDDLVYKPLDNDTVGGHYSFTETFSPMKNDPYDFYFVELQPGTLSVDKTPFCSEQIAMCYYDFASSHAWTEYGRVFFSGSVAHDITQSQISMSTYYRNNTQEAVFNTGDMFMSSTEHPERGGAYRMWYNYKGDNSTTSVSPVQGCPAGYTLNGSTCTADPLCSTGTYDSISGECVSNASPSCPSGYDYNNNAGTCVADASCPGTGTLNSSTNKCETYLGENCPGTYNIQGNECVGNASCPSGTQFNANTDKCEEPAQTECPTGYTYNSSLDKCTSSVICPAGTTFDSSSGKCTAQQQCSTTSGTCSAVHSGANKLYVNSAYGYSLSQMKFFNPSINETDIVRCGDDSIKICIRGSCTSCIPFCSNTGESSKVYVGFKSGIYDEDDYTHVTNGRCPGSPYEYIDIKSGWDSGVPYIQVWKTCSNGNHKWTYMSYSSTTTDLGQSVNAYYSQIQFSDQKDSSNYLTDDLLQWYSYTFNDHGIKNCGIELLSSRGGQEISKGSFGNSGFYIEGQSDSYSDAIYAYIPYKCSTTGTAYKTQSECQNNCTATTCTCPSGTTLSGNECTANYTCPAGGSYDSNLQKCAAVINHCPSGYTYDSSGNTCQIDPTCDYGTFDTSSNECVVQASSSCETGYTQNNDTCVADPQCQSPGSYDSTLKKCSAGIANNGCPSGSSYANGQCFSAPSCPGNGTWNSSDKECETGTTLTCPTGYTLSGDSCISSGGGSAAVTNLTEFGITQTNTQDNITEEFGMYFPVGTLTAAKEGFIRKISDLPPDEKRGYASNRHSDWLDFNAGSLNYFFQDTGQNPGTCPSGQVTTDDGCFKDQADLCPSGQVELYPDHKGVCYALIENAACWNGQLQIGNKCFKKLSNTPNVCPSDGRSYTLLTPTTADYVCKTTTQPSCPSGDIRDGNTCYKTEAPSCPTGYTLSGGNCIKSVAPSCPSGETVISGGCYYTASPSCPSGYYLSGNRQCAKDEWISAEVDDCYDANWNIIQWGQNPQCPSGYTKVAGLGRWHPVNGQAVGTCSSVSGTKNTAVGTHYAICHATTNASCPSGYSFSSDYQVNGSFTALGHSHDYYDKSNNSLIKFGAYRWDYNESAVTCGSLYNHTYTCYDSASVYGGFVDSTIENESATRICFNTSHRNCTAASDGCVKYDKTACPSGYSYNGSQCQTTISACPRGYTYDSDSGKCIDYDRQACSISPYDWTYDSANDICIYETDAQCSPGMREKADNATYSACYQLDTAYGQPPGHIYCRNNYTYWDYGNKEGCYQEKGTACNGQYQSEPDPDVIIGSGNQYNEWTGKCWVKTKDLCGSGELYGRGEYQPSGVYHCLTKNFKYDYITPGQVTAPTLSKYMCDYILHGNLNVDSSAICWKADIDNATDVWYDFNNPHAPMDDKYRPICPIDKNERCTWLGGSLEVCGTNKKCAYCTKNVDKSVDYADIKKIAYYNGKFFGLTYNTHTFDQAQQMATDMSASLPSSGQSGEVNAAFSMSVNCWYSNTAANSSVLYKPVVVIWRSLSNVGFFAPCDFDSNGDMICTVDLTKCSNGQCPYGSQYTCQPYNGGEYCSRFSNLCYNMGNPSNTIQTLQDTQQGLNDKKNDGNVTENGCEGNVYIFNGKDLRCRLPGLETGFANCCKKHKDWFGMGKCKQSEVLLQQKVDTGVCHEVGTYCSKKILGMCIQKKKTYCCFNSVLGRIVQEQSRKKQSLPAKDWGKPKDPICWGFKPAQFQALDWSQIDLSEYYSYIEKKVVPKATAAAQNAEKNAAKKLQKQMQNMFSQ